MPQPLPLSRVFYTLFLTHALLLAAGGLRAQTVGLATHDWNHFDIRTPDTWADVKQTGNGLTYSVGTTIAGNPNVNPVANLNFSNVDAVYAAPAAADWGTAGTKQVAIIQIAEPGQPHGIQKQAYYHGIGSNRTGTTGDSTFAHAISVWPGATPQSARIAICGSTRDPHLPQHPPSQPANPAGNPPFGVSPDTGFIAVYDGNLNLQWSYQFYAGATNARTIITDVCIRVENGRDYVTYCGISNNGAPSSPPLSTMWPERAFMSPGSFLGDSYAAGDSDNNTLTNPYGQWDGIVGRLSSLLTANVPSLDFHSVVGGSGDDLLFGIAQKELDRFVVVGTSSSSAMPAAGSLAFPLTDQSLFGGGTMEFATSNSWEIGTVLEFEAPDMTIAAPGNAPNPDFYLKLKASRPIGSSGSATVARDVLWQDSPGNEDFVYIVGSTTYPGLAADYPTHNAGTYYGAASGFLVATIDLLLPTSARWMTARYINQWQVPGTSGGSPGTPAGLADATGAIGVAAWNEYHNHVAIVGWSEFSQGKRILTSNCYREPYAPPGAGWQGVDIIRQSELGPAWDPALRDEMPGASTAIGLTTLLSSPSFPTNSILGTGASGSIAVDSRGDITVVGHTQLPPLPPTAHFPITGPPGEVRAPQAQDPSAVQVDALRLQINMLPQGTILVDSDGAPWATGTHGGTTPSCALSQYGNTLGPAPLERMQLDIDGAPGPGSSIDVLVDRPVNAAFVLGGLFVGMPSPQPSPWPGLEILINTSLLVPGQAFSGVISEALRIPMTLPIGSGSFTTQFVCLLSARDYCAVPSCAVTTPCQGSLALSAAASPALWITY